MPNTREKLIELLKTIPQVNHAQAAVEGIDYVFGCAADHLIANGVTVNEWISVKDRLPDVATVHNTRWDKSTDSIRVLCACIQADGKKMVKEGYCKVYSDGFVHWKIPGTIHSVTHWMPLPQPPKGEGE